MSHQAPGRARPQRAAQRVTATPSPREQHGGHAPCADRLHRLLEVTGGFTLHHRSGAALANGVSVCADPSRTMCFPFEAWDDDAVEGWVAEQVRHLGRRGLCLGGWLDEHRTAWLDVVRVFPRHHRSDAVALGHRFRQRAVYDLDRHEVVTIDHDDVAQQMTGT